MTDEPRKTEHDEETPAGDPAAGSAADAEELPQAESKPDIDSAVPPEAANNRDVPEEEVPETGISETGESPGSGEPEAPALTEDQQRIVDLETEIAELRDRALRAMAEADNTRKRASRDVAESRKYGATPLARDVLTVADNLGRALQAVPEVSPEDDENLFNLRTGVDMTLKELLQGLERHGVKKVTPEAGERFDHNRHQAMFEVPTGDLAPGAVAQVVQDGYVIHDRLLRPALVGVARKPAEDAAPEPEDAAETPEEAPPPAESAEESDAA